MQQEKSIIKGANVDSINLYLEFRFEGNNDGLRFVLKLTCRWRNGIC